MKGFVNFHYAISLA
jgi:hypothetical protein